MKATADGSSVKSNMNIRVLSSSVSESFYWGRGISRDSEMISRFITGRRKVGMASLSPHIKPSVSMSVT
jgi:hypothetical protein